MGVQENKLKEFYYAAEAFKECVKDVEDDLYGEWFMAVNYQKTLHRFLDDCLAFCRDLDEFLGGENGATGNG